MNFKNEGEFDRWWSDRLRAQGALVITLAGGNHFQQSGLPDRLVVHRRFFGFVEGKMMRTTTRTIQRITMRAIVARGQPALVLRHVDGTLQLEREDGTLLEVMGLDADLLEALERNGK